MSVDDERQREGGHDGDDHVLCGHIVVRAVSEVAGTCKYTDGKLFLVKREYYTLFIYIDIYIYIYLYILTYVYLYVSVYKKIRA